MRAAARSAAEAPHRAPMSAPARVPASPVSAAEFAALMAPLGPFGAAPRLVTGVSGGPHSLALTLLLARWAEAEGGALLPVIVDHGLRAESAAEAAGVAAMLRARGLAPRIVALGMAGGAALQARARDGRLAALLGVAAAEGAPWLALGHHRDDQAETVLLRALAGSGAAGLAGMAPARAAGAALVIRPLLGVAPARLEAVVEAAGLVPVRDPANADPRFARARLRPTMGAAEAMALATAAGCLGRRRAAMQRAVAARLAEAAAWQPEGFARLDRAALGQDGVAVAALAGLIRLVGGGAYAPGVAHVAALLARGHGTLGGAVLTPAGLLLREAAAMAPPVPALAGARWDGRWQLEVGAPGCVIGALGAAAAGVPRPAWLPAGVARTLPALWRPGEGACNWVLVEVPALGYALRRSATGLRLRFAPEGGPLA
jgi:tRNA(Ile)-lysidine synthase